MIVHDVLVVGGGLAGLRAALELNKRNVRVGVLSKVHPLRSHSVAAQGGINAALGNHPRGLVDSWERHAFDTIKGSDYLADQPAVVRMVKDAPRRVFEMEHWGCAFSRTDDGRIAQRPFGGAGFPRTCYAADKTGHVFMHTLYEQLIRYEQAAEREEIIFYSEWMVTRLVVEDGVCVGVIALHIQSGRLEAFRADAVIFATGGAGRIYGNSTNALINTGMGMAVPYWAGVPLKDMEFVQFHPTTLVGTNILISEGARGEGGYLINAKGERFLANYPDSRKAMEVAPRDIVARHITTEILEGRGVEDAYVYLDLRHLGLERILQRLPGIRDLAMKFAGVDPVEEPIPVQPGQHYTMGGIDTNRECETAVQGFYAAGECACVSVHGANRLGGNSLLETIVFGAIAGEQAAAYLAEKTGPPRGERALALALKDEEAKVQALLRAEGPETPGAIREAMNRVMMEKVGVFRDRKGLSEALETIQALKERFRRIRLGYRGTRLNYDLKWALELQGSLDVAEAMVASALAREESRGSHFRTDFPQRDDARWLKHTLATWTPQGPRLSYKPVELGYFEPKARVY